MTTTGSGDDFSGDDDDQGSEQPAPASNAIGVTVQPLTPAIARQVGVDSTVQGVVVSAVDPSSDAGQKLRRGDVISAINGTPVRSAADLARGVQAAKSAGRPQVLLMINRARGQSGFVPVKIK